VTSAAQSCSSAALLVTTSCAIYRLKPQTNAQSMMNKCLAALVLVAILLLITMFSIDDSMYKSVSTLMATPRPSRPKHCQRIRNTTKTMPTSTAPPWFNNNDSSNNENLTNRSREVLYVWPTEGRKQRLGNRLFMYASTFGIAWRNGRMPIYPDASNGAREYDLPRYFNLRIPIDTGNKIRTVRSDDLC